MKEDNSSDDNKDNLIAKLPVSDKYVPPYDYHREIARRDSWEPNRSKIPYDSTRL